MYISSKIKSKQITTVVMTSLALITGIASLVNKFWTCELSGRICQFFYWGFHKIFNGVAMDKTPYEVYSSVSGSESLRNANPLFTLELLILFAFLAVVVNPLGILIEETAKKHFKHFFGVHTLLFVLSVLSWLIVLPLLVMQFFPGSPIVLGFSPAGTVVALHVWFYLTLLLYIVMADFYGVTSRSSEFEYENCKIANTWHGCWQVCRGVCIALGVIFAFWILIFVFIARSSARNAI